SDFGYNLLDRTRGVPPFGAVLPIVPKELYKLSEVHIQPKALGDGAGIMNQAIRRQLHRAGKPFVQVPQERGSCLLRSLPNVERGDKFRLRINGNKNPLIANFIGVSLADVAGFLLNEAPDFINFQIPGPQIAHHGTHQFLAAIASVNKQAKNCISIQPGKTLSRSNGTSFQEALNCFGGGIGPRCESIACKSFVGFAESGTARITAPALNAAFTEVSELLASVVLASYACHGLFSACVEREKPYNVVGSELRLIPRFGLALPPVSADDRALIVNRGLRRYNGNFHRRPKSSDANYDYDFHCSPFSRKRSVLPAQSVSYLTQKSCQAGKRSIADPDKKHTFVLRDCFLHASIVTFTKSIQDCHNRAQRLRIFLKVKTGLLKLFANFCAFHAFMALLQQPLNCIAEGRSATLRIGDFSNYLLFVFIIGHKSHETSQQNTQFGNFLVGVIPLRDALFKFLAGFTDDLIRI